jgi:integrase
VVVPIGGSPTVAALISEFARRYDNPRTRHQYVAELTDLFRVTGRRLPSELGDADVLRWCAGMGRPVANNTVRNRLSRVTTFLRWCVRHGLADPVLVEALCDRTNPLRRVPRLYGKLQGKHPARWLSYDEAFGQLLASCRRDGEVGLRDELVLRLGLAGMRAAEIIGLRMGEVYLEDAPPQIGWIGKARRSRRIVCGAELVEILRRYLAIYRAHSPHHCDAEAHLVCRQKPGSGAGQVSWGNPIFRTCSIQRIVRLRAEAAGLGHMSPHDLRRSAAGILHRAVGEDGGHLFDLRDIQQVLDHSDPVTTQRSYLDPLDTGTKERAAALLD